MSAISSRWYWTHGGDRGGPITWDELQSLARQGRLRADDWVLREGSQQWQRAGTARGDAPGNLPQAAGVAAPPPPLAQQVPVTITPDLEGSEDGPREKAPNRGLRRMVIGTIFFLGGILGIVLTYDPERLLIGGRYAPFRIAIIFGIIQFCRGIAEAGSND